MAKVAADQGVKREDGVITAMVLLPLVLVLVLLVLPLLLVMDALSGLLFLRLAVAMLLFLQG